MAEEKKVEAKVVTPIMGKTLPLNENEAQVLMAALRNLNKGETTLEASTAIINIHNRIGIIFSK